MIPYNYPETRQKIKNIKLFNTLKCPNLFLDFFPADILTVSLINDIPFINKVKKQTACKLTSKNGEAVFNWINFRMFYKDKQVLREVNGSIPFEKKSFDLSGIIDRQIPQLYINGVNEFSISVAIKVLAYGQEFWIHGMNFKITINHSTSNDIHKPEFKILSQTFTQNQILNVKAYYIPKIHTESF
jgi:hypothetical protein